MSSDLDDPLDLFIVSYYDTTALRLDWETIQGLDNDGAIKLEGLARVEHRNNGKIHVVDDAHHKSHGAKWGMLGGAIVGLIFPPSLVVGAGVGALAGAGVGGLKSHHGNATIEADVATALPIGRSGLVVLVDEQWASMVESAIQSAGTIALEKVDRNSFAQVQAAIDTALPTPPQ